MKLQREQGASCPVTDRLDVCSDFRGLGGRGWVVPSGTGMEERGLQRSFVFVFFYFCFFGDFFRML